jgi:hypothetical protein
MQSIYQIDCLYWSNKKYVSKVFLPTRDDFAIEVGGLLQEPDVLQQLRTARSSGEHVLAVNRRTTGVRGQFLFISHDAYFLHGLKSCSHDITDMQFLLLYRLNHKFSLSR